MEGVTLSGRYRLLRRIGAGSMGIVFEARDAQSDVRAAVKMLCEPYGDLDRVRHGFHSATRLSSRLAHPNIARTLAFADPNDEHPFAVSELLDGSPLTAYLKPGQAYEPPHALLIVQAILQALSFAHDSGALHGDISPENVFLVRQSNGPPVVKLLDFGMIEVINSAGGVMARSPSGELLGHAGYLSPEQTRGDSIDMRSDVFSVGVLLYELLTGRRAFPATDEVTQLRALANAEVLPVDHGRPELAPYKALLAQVLTRDPDQRLSSPMAMEQALAGAAEEAEQMSVRPAATAITDLSPELPPGIGRPPRAAVVVTSPPVPLPLAMAATKPGVPDMPAQPRDAHGTRPAPLPISEPLLAPRIRDPMSRNSEPFVRPAPPSGVPVWVLLVVALICTALGFAAGLLVPR
jgi:serine/threonine protein kinase